jgi:hypothetical protein
MIRFRGVASQVACCGVCVRAGHWCGKGESAAARCAG